MPLVRILKVDNICIISKVIKYYYENNDCDVVDDDDDN